MAHRPLARGDVILISFPFTDLSGQKLRPAVIVGRVSGDDLIVAFVTSRLGGADQQTDVPLDQAQADYARSGLRVPSLIRADKLATLQRNLALRRIGSIGPSTEASVARALRYVFEL